MASGRFSLVSPTSVQSRRETWQRLFLLMAWSYLWFGQGISAFSEDSVRNKVRGVRPAQVVQFSPFDIGGLHSEPKWAGHAIVRKGIGGRSIPLIPSLEVKANVFFIQRGFGLGLPEEAINVKRYCAALESCRL